MNRRATMSKDLHLELIEILGRDSCGNDGVVIGHLGVVEDPLVRSDPSLGKRLLRVCSSSGSSNFVSTALALPM